MPKISVISPSIRVEGLEIVRATLAHQTFRDFEWIPKLSVPGPVPDLCASVNQAIREAKGELVVFLQDYIKIGEDGLERMWDHYQKNPGVMLTCPVGQTTDWVGVDFDWRVSVDPKAVLEYYQWEIDWGSVPLSLLRAAGGFDEDYDSGFGWENVDLAYRLHKLGHKVLCDPDNVAVSYRHDLLAPHPYKPRPNRDLWAGKQREIDSGRVVLGFLEPTEVRAAASAGPGVL